MFNLFLYLVGYTVLNSIILNCPPLNSSNYSSEANKLLNNTVFTSEYNNLFFGGIPGNSKSESEFDIQGWVKQIKLSKPKIAVRILRQFFLTRNNNIYNQFTLMENILINNRTHSKKSVFETKSVDLKKKM